MSTLDGTANTILAGQKSMYVTDYANGTTDVTFLNLAAAGGTLLGGTASPTGTIGVGNSTLATSRGNASVIFTGTSTWGPRNSLTPPGRSVTCRAATSFGTCSAGRTGTVCCSCSATPTFNLPVTPGAKPGDGT